MKKSLLFAIALLCVLTLAGCGKKDKELAEYKTQVESFYDTVFESSQKINNITATDDAAKEEMLTELDNINAAFQEFAEVTAPKEFSNVDESADAAAEAMSQANALYHEFFAKEEYDEALALNAKARYSEAIAYVNEMGAMLSEQK